jgi:hypothetical protein
MVNIPSNTFLVEFSKKRKFEAAVAKHKKNYCRNLKLGKEIILLEHLFPSSQDVLFSRGPPPSFVYPPKKETRIEQEKRNQKSRDSQRMKRSKQKQGKIFPRCCLASYTFFVRRRREKKCGRAR